MPLGQVNVYSPVDVSVPGIIECRRVEAPEWVVIGLDTAKAAVDIYRWLSKLPF